MTLPPNKPIPKQSQDIAQLQIYSEISLLERSKTQDKLITTTHARFVEIFKLKEMNREGMQDIIKEIPPMQIHFVDLLLDSLTYLCYNFQGYYWVCTWT